VPTRHIPTTCSPSQRPGSLWRTLSLRCKRISTISQFPLPCPDGRSWNNASIDGLQLLTAFTLEQDQSTKSSEIQTQGGNVKNDPQYAYRRDLDRAWPPMTRLDASSRACLRIALRKGKRWLNSGRLVNAILGGWQANSIITVADGLPFTYFLCYCGDRAQTGNSRNVEREEPGRQPGSQWIQ